MYGKGTGGGVATGGAAAGGLAATGASNVAILLGVGIAMLVAGLCMIRTTTVLRAPRR
jgi:hypothetical protein